MDDMKKAETDLNSTVILLIYMTSNNEVVVGPLFKFHCDSINIGADVFNGQNSVLI